MTLASSARVAIPGLLRADFELRAVAEAHRVEQQRAAVQVRGDRDGPPDRVYAASAHRGIGRVERVLVERLGDPQGRDPDAGLFRRVRQAAGVVAADVERQIGADRHFDGVEPGGLWLARSTRPGASPWER